MQANTAIKELAEMGVKDFSPLGLSAYGAALRADSDRIQRKVDLLTLERELDGDWSPHWVRIVADLLRAEGREALADLALERLEELAEEELAETEREAAEREDWAETCRWSVLA